jgi:hypothetical protein
VNTSQNYLNEIQKAVEQFGWPFENPIETIQNIFRTISGNFISAFLTIIDDRNNMLDSTRDLVLNYELFYANNMAATNTIISGVVNILRVAENTEWISTNIFRILEVNFRGLFHDLASLYREVTGNHVIISRQISQVFIVLNRMYKSLKQIINNTGLNIIDRIFESITITYQQITNDANANRNTIISTLSNQFNEFSSNFITEFNMMRINFQTMDANDRLILQSNNEINENIQTQTITLNVLKENMERMSDVISYILQETIAAFIQSKQRE